MFNDIVAIDEEGLEYPDLSAAKAAAIESARELMAEQIRKGRPVDLNHRIEVATPDGEVIATIPFRELITITDSGTASD
ncbi:DUF6894 family protein [Sphingomonas sp. DT-207]|uniref:DUF6894 family protein n=1 Tax=Sphingomonas sp. DT-207 TaxID=3396167 RepID=UPI003F53F88A